MLEALQFDFMRNALAAGILAGIACGIIGTYVVVNRIVFISGGIAHAAYGGVGLSFFLGISPLFGILGFTLAVSFVIAFISLKAKHRADTIIGVLWAVGMALGVIFIDLTPGYNVDLMSYLFGSILTVPAEDLWLIAGLDAFIVGAVFFFYHDFVALSYDEEFAIVRGVPVRFLYFLLMAMIALSVVMIIQVVGLILVIALLSIPPYIAEKYSNSLFGMMVVSIILNLLFTISGLWVSYSFNITSGASIIMIAAFFFFLSLIVDILKRKRLRFH